MVKIIKILKKKFKVKKLKEETQLLDDHLEISKNIDNKIEEGFSYRELKDLYKQLYIIKAKLNALSEEYDKILSSIS